LRKAQDFLNHERHQATLQQLAATPAVSPDSPYAELFFQRGISIVADREAFGSETTHQILKQLREHGFDAIAITGMGRAPDPNGGLESEAEIELLTRRAHLLGMKVLLKPHHTPRWSREPNVDAWFRVHEQTMETYARLAARIHADLLSVGYEMGPAYRNEAAWRKIIARVRALYPGPLTLSPNHGEEFEGIRFWDALDYVGIDNYIPMPPGGDYTSIARYFEEVHRKTGKPILFTEAGFASVDGAGREPWAEPDRALSHEEQIRCYRAVLEAVYTQPWFHGVYWWKVDTDGLGGPHDRTLTPWRKPVMNLIREWFAGPLRR
jgi:hypothetical protein